MALKPTVRQLNKKNSPRTKKKIAATKSLATSKPVISKQDLVSVLRCLLSDKLTEVDGGIMTSRLEHDFAMTVGADNSLFVVNDSAALYLILKKIGIRLGDEVIVSPLIEPQLWETLRNFGAKIVFCDCDQDNFSDNFSFSAKLLQKHLSKKTRLLILSHAFGLAHLETRSLISRIRADFPEIIIIEEALHSLGTLYSHQKKANHVGTLGDYGLFSLSSHRTLTSAKGAVIIAKCRDDLEELRALRAPIWGDFRASIENKRHLALGRVAKKPSFKTWSPKIPASYLTALNDVQKKQATKPIKTDIKSISAAKNENWTSATPNGKKSPPIHEEIIPHHHNNIFTRLDFAPTELEAALGCSQLELLKSFAERRRALIGELEQAVLNKKTIKIIGHSTSGANNRFLPLYFQTGKAIAYERLIRSGMPDTSLHSHTLYGYLEYFKLHGAYNLSRLKAIENLHRRVLLIPINASITANELRSLVTVLKSL
ncbi:hypothetical protein COTS27_00561 [Spirochaetota bacterium]|nr:hypothetical protein COTS27_00561 [Spirochaetota bacterium]